WYSMQRQPYRLTVTSCTGHPRIGPPPNRRLEERHARAGSVPQPKAGERHARAGSVPQPKAGGRYRSRSEAQAGVGGRGRGKGSRRKGHRRFISDPQASILEPVTLQPDNPWEMPRAAVWARGLTRRFGKYTAVDNLNLSIEAGEFYGLLGQNGAGKTTTIRMIVGLLRPDEGTAGIGEFDTWKQPTEVKARIGVLPEEFNLYERLTGAELLDFTGAMHGLGREETVARRDELLEMLDL